MENNKSAKMLRQRKMLLVLPFLILPFITIMFWSLGGGKGATGDGQSAEEKGFNINLPGANLKEGTPQDKMNYYEQAALDSAKLQELIKKDPGYIRKDSAHATANPKDTVLAGHSFLTNQSGLNVALRKEPNEDKVYRKLNALQRAISMPADAPVQNYSRDNTTLRSTDGEIEKLEAMMQSMNQPSNADPELQQLSGMLENILDIQHPARAQEKLRKASEEQRGQVFSITTSVSENTISSLQDENTVRAFSGGSGHNGFYSLDEPIEAETFQNAVQAVIHETQTIVNGSTVKLRLANDIFINGIKIPKNTFLFGTAALKGERLAIKITSLRFNNSIFPVDLSVYDMDGLDGIYIPGAINRDVAKASADQSMQTLGVTTLDDSWGAQAAGAGIEAAKTLFSKKVKLIKVVVKAGYLVLLRDEKQKQKDSN